MAVSTRAAVVRQMHSTMWLLLLLLLLLATVPASAQSRKKALEQYQYIVADFSADYIAATTIGLKRQNMRADGWYYGYATGNVVSTWTDAPWGSTMGLTEYYTGSGLGLIGQNWIHPANPKKTAIKYLFRQKFPTGVNVSFQWSQSQSCDPAATIADGVTAQVYRIVGGTANSIKNQLVGRCDTKAWSSAVVNNLAANDAILVQFDENANSGYDTTSVTFQIRSQCSTRCMSSYCLDSYRLNCPRTLTYTFAAAVPTASQSVDATASQSPSGDLTASRSTAAMSRTATASASQTATNDLTASRSISALSRTASPTHDGTASQLMISDVTFSRTASTSPSHFANSQTLMGIRSAILTTSTTAHRTSHTNTRTSLAISPSPTASQNASVLLSAHSLLHSLTQQVTQSSSSSSPFAVTLSVAPTASSQPSKLSITTTASTSTTHVESATTTLVHHTPTASKTLLPIRTATFPPTTTPLRSATIVGQVAPSDDIAAAKAVMNDATDAAIAAAGAIGSPATALAMQRIGLVDTFCDPIDLDRLSYMDSPTQATIAEGSLQYHFGAVVTNPLVVLGVVVVTAGSSIIIAKFTRQSFERVLVLTRSVHIQLFVFMLLLQPTVTSVGAIAVYAPFSWQSYASAVVLCIVLLMGGTVAYIVLHRHFAARYEVNQDEKEVPEAKEAPLLNLEDPEEGACIDGNGDAKSTSLLPPTAARTSRLLSWLRYWFTPRGEWVNRTPTPPRPGSRVALFFAGLADFVTLFEPFFADYRAPHHRFILIDTSVSVLIAVVQAIGQAFGCQIGSPLLLLVLFGYLIILLQKRPHAARIDLAFAIVMAALQTVFAVSLVAMAFTQNGGEQDRPAAVETLIFVLQGIALARGIYEIMQLTARIFGRCCRRRKATEAAATPWYDTFEEPVLTYTPPPPPPPLPAEEPTTVIEIPEPPPLPPPPPPPLPLAKKPTKSKRHFLAGANDRYEGDELDSGRPDDSDDDVMVLPEVPVSRAIAVTDDMAAAAVRRRIQAGRGDRQQRDDEDVGGDLFASISIQVRLTSPFQQQQQQRPHPSQSNWRSDGALPLNNNRRPTVAHAVAVSATLSRELDALLDDGFDEIFSQPAAVPVPAIEYHDEFLDALLN
jgi:opacity protein-like surface antigen